MENAINLYKIIPYLVYGLSIVLSGAAGLLVYTGLTPEIERQQTRYKLRNSIHRSKEIFVQKSNNSKAEIILKNAQYPLGLNGAMYYGILTILSAFLIGYYVILPILINQGIPSSSLVILFIILMGVVLCLPSFPFSLFNYVMKRVIEFHHAKKQAEVFMLYDLLINEIEMMTVSRINTYSILRDLKPYFQVLKKPLAKLLSSWSSDEGPKVALNKFGQELNSKEGEALIGVIQTLDDIDRDTALSHLRGMQKMFIRSQIETYRRKRKVTTDLAGIPIKITHFAIILNFMVVIVVMVATILNNVNM